MSISNYLITVLSASSNVAKINKTSLIYTKTAIALFAMAAVFFVISVFIWFKMNIRHEIIVLTGFGVKKEVARIEKKAMRETEDANIAPIINRDGMQNADIMDNNITQKLGNRQTMPIRHTVPIGVSAVNNRNIETTPIGFRGSEEETALLEENIYKAPQNNNASFVVEKDEVYISDNKQ